MIWFGYVAEDGSIVWFGTFFILRFLNGSN